MKLPIWAIILIVIGGLVLLAALFGTDSTDESNNNSSSNSYSDTDYDDKKVNNKNKTYSLGDTFVFDGYEITLGNEYSFKVVKNQFSDNNGDSVIKLPATIKNVSEETGSMNMFYYNFFGSKGTEVDNLAAYFDESVDYGGDLRPNASYTKYFYIQYDGDGTYGIDFDNYSDKISVEFKISK